MVTSAVRLWSVGHPHVQIDIPVMVALPADTVNVSLTKLRLPVKLGAP
jgi:hypothetical protein